MYQIINSIIGSYFKINLPANKSIPAGQYWTSASDEGCENAFGWCAVNKLVWKGVWETGQPDNLGGKENCVGLNLDTSKAEIRDEDCTKQMLYICEALPTVILFKVQLLLTCNFKARDTSKSTTAGKAIKDECAAIFNISECLNIFNLFCHIAQLHYFFIIIQLRLTIFSTVLHLTLG